MKEVKDKIESLIELIKEKGVDSDIIPEMRKIAIVSKAHKEFVDEYLEVYNNLEVVKDHASEAAKVEISMSQASAAILSLELIKEIEEGYEDALENLSNTLCLCRKFRKLEVYAFMKMIEGLEIVAERNDISKENMEYIVIRKMAEKILTENESDIENAKKNILVAIAKMLISSDGFREIECDAKYIVSVIIYKSLSDADWNESINAIISKNVSDDELFKIMRNFDVDTIEKIIKLRSSLKRSEELLIDETDEESLVTNITGLMLAVYNTTGDL